MEINKWKLPIAAARLIENGPEEEKKALKKLIFKELNKYNKGKKIWIKPVN